MRHRDGKGPLRQRVRVVDVGFNIGQDAAAYLEMGYDVIAVEANPMLVAWANRTEPFQSAIASGRLVLLNRLIVQIGKENEVVPFFIGRHTERSVPYECDSPPCKKVDVRTISCDVLNAQHGPFHMFKIDCDERGDIWCIDGVLDSMRRGARPPKYLSVEAAPAGLKKAKIKELAAAGFDAFKYTDGHKSKGGRERHGAGSGPFGEFVFDQTTKYGWHSLESILSARRTGDIHMKHASAWTHRASNDLLLSWKQSSAWPLA